jgi:hypothetical protein
MQSHSREVAFPAARKRVFAEHSIGLNGRAFYAGFVGGRASCRPAGRASILCVSPCSSFFRQRRRAGRFVAAPDSPSSLRTV